MSENDPPTYSQLIRKLPYRLQRRFESFGNYVDGILSEKEPKGGWNLSEALIFALKTFLNQGTIIAKQAIRVFGVLLSLDNLTEPILAKLFIEPQTLRIISFGGNSLWQDN